MNELLQNLFWQSDVGQRIKADALKKINDQEAAALAKIADAQETRDRRLAVLDAELKGREAEHIRMKAAFAEAEEKFKASHWRCTVGLPGEMEEARRLHNVAVTPIREELKRLAQAKAELDRGK